MMLTWISKMSRRELRAELEGLFNRPVTWENRPGRGVEKHYILHYILLADENGEGEVVFLSEEKARQVIELCAGGAEQNGMLPNGKADG